MVVFDPDAHTNTIIGLRTLECFAVLGYWASCPNMPGYEDPRPCAEWLDMPGRVILAAFDAGLSRCPAETRTMPTQAE